MRRPIEPQPPHVDVLVVDDNDVNRRILVELVKRRGMRTTAVASGRAALDALSAAARTDRPFALVLLDVKMPDMDGFEVAAEIAKRPELAGAAILMLSSSGDHSEQARCAALGISAYLTKPVYATELLTAIERALGSRRAVVASAVARSSAGAMAMGSAGRRARILLVEDNLVNQRVASGLLTRRGHHVTVAGDGREALAQLDRETFDLILMDLQMPVMGGVDATIAIRERERATGQHVRIVAMTAHAMNSDRERCLAAGMDGYLSKPVEPAILFAVVEQGGVGGSAAPVSEGRGIFDEAALRERLGGDDELMGDVIRLFLDDLPIRLAAIEEAVTARNVDAIRTAAHALKGAAGSLSAGGLFDAAHRLERAGAESQPESAAASWSQLSMEARNLRDVLRAYAGPVESARAS